MSNATHTVGEAAFDCLTTPLILISGSNSDSNYAGFKLTHILPSPCDPDFKAHEHE